MQRNILILLISFLFCFGCDFKSADSEKNDLKKIYQVLQNKKLDAGQKLSKWILYLGKPITVSQIDKAKTLFYWPEKGIGVFTHPLYHGQSRYFCETNRIVTSFFIITQTNAPALSPPAITNTFIKFTINENLVSNCLNSIYKHLSKNDVSENKNDYKKINITPFFSHFFNKNIILHIKDGKIVFIEVQLPDKFFEYD